MQRSILKWTAIAVFTMVGTLLLLGLNHHSVLAARTEPKSQTQASLQALTRDGVPVGECPLKHTEVKAEVSGFISRVTVTQEFENPYADKIEAVYTFPLPQAAAVDDLTMLIGERIVKGKIMRREEAQAAYEKAKTLGQVASLLHQERPNIFTQSVANIMPGQQIRITISYVETLKYADGSYEWTFPMVVGPRYIPASTGNAQVDNAVGAAPESVPDARSITPPVAKGMRAGHDISLEVALDAGVPLDTLSSKTHEIDVERADERRAVVRLKDQAVIPNKDFVLNYKVAGQKIEDAVLAHRSGREGFFTLILQPPQRVTAEDVMPKELVFVLDTSGSMEGFPLDKARETMKLALKNLYPHDTFNVITFSGDTHLLFREPVPATEENLHKAQNFLSSRKSNGGTEMMQAIRAALTPSDSQQHVRITCFMTDGQVGNDMEILSEVQKHPNARVFAMGFGSAPNRYLLDKMAEYGRGEVDYIAETGNTSSVASRFNERIRNPLLTDLSVEWDGLAVTEVYPKRIPDLFSSRPVVLTGRYTNGGKGIIRLRGMMAGQKFVREIAVELPDNESRHDVLGTLWARQRIDELMGQDMAGLQEGKMQKEPREEITQLGIKFKLMTQFTSFVAIDEVIFTTGGEPRRVDVPIETPAGASGSGMASDISEMVTVTSCSVSLNVCSTDVSTISERKIEDLPLQGRSYQSLVQLVPGTVPAGQVALEVTAPASPSVNGQSPNANMFLVDGVSANFGITPGGISPGVSAAGGTPALTAGGGANGLASLNATEEVEIRTTNAGAEFGRVPGAQISVVSRSGTNTFHGSMFHSFGNNLVDASDWFANSRGLRPPARRLNNFGGVFGGPVRRDRIFFFAAYEGLRLRQPMTAITDVPSLAARQLAPAGIQPFLEAFPIPNGAARTDGFAEFAASFANPAIHDVASLHIDSHISTNLAFSGRYSFADSAATERAQGGFSLNTRNRIASRAQTLTGALTYMVSPRIVTELRANYSRLGVHSSYLLDDFGGSTLPVGSAWSVFSLANGSFSFNLNGRGAVLMSGNDVASTQRQLNVVSSLTIVAGSHDVKFGGDYRRLSPIIGMRASDTSALFDGVAQSQLGVAGRISTFTRSGLQHAVFNNLSLYAQDEWRLTKRLTLTFGMRWEVNPAPSGGDGRSPLAITQVADPAQLTLAADGTALWRTTHTNFAPRASFAYQLSKDNEPELILRGGLGLFYDLGHDQAGSIFTDSFPFLAGRSVFNAPFPAALPERATAVEAAPIDVPFSAFDPALKLPYSWQWNLSIQRALGDSQTVSAAYIGSAGRRLLNTRTLFGSAPDFAFVRLTTNGANSDYHSMQLHYDRRFSHGLSGLMSYTWSKSLDNHSQDSASRALLISPDPERDRGPSDFDARHAVAGSVTFELPSIVRRGFGKVLLRKWTIDSIFIARSARPVNVVYDFPTSFGFAYLRPDLIGGVPLHLFDSTFAGGRIINPAAFLATSDSRQGTLGRNSLRGFAQYQIDLALRRRFELSENISLLLAAEAFNLLNHPNFADPLGIDTSLGSKFDQLGPLHPNATFGQSASLNGRSVGGGGAGAFGSFYSTGGPRVLRFSVKLRF